MKTLSPTAFTLIELLIVVAIIAILAAIAVPNFLEAQVRAKVSRLKNDLRTADLALMAYSVDNSKFPWPRVQVYGSEGQWSCSSLPYVFELSTPIAYVANVSVFKNVFAPHNIWKDMMPGAKWGFLTDNTVPIQYTNLDPVSGKWGSDRVAENKNSRLTRSFTLEAYGPDRKPVWPTFGVFEYGSFTIPQGKPYIQIPFGTSPYPPALQEAWAAVYDPTNGTISHGGIFRMNGQIQCPNF